MNKKQKFIAGAMALTLITSAAPMSVSAKAKAKAPAKVTVTSVKRVSNTKTTVKWKKLKKNTSGYAVYTKAGSSKWRLTKKVGKKTASVTFATSPESKYQVKVRAYKNGKKVKKYYNKKSKKFVSKKAYKKLKKKNRTTKKVTSVKWGKYSSTKTINAVFGNTINTPNGSFDKNEDAALTWSKVNGAKKYEVYYSDGGAYKLIDTVSGNAYTDTMYNPTKTISYKVRPVNGAYTGAWSKVQTMCPQDITNSEGHHHDWKMVQEKKQIGTKKVEETHDICQACGKDLNDWYVAAKEQAKEMGIERVSETPIYQETIAKHDQKHLDEGAWNAGSTRPEIVTVEKPVYGMVNVAKCDCGATRTVR